MAVENRPVGHMSTGVRALDIVDIEMTRPEEIYLQELLLELEEVPRPQLQQKFLTYFQKQNNGSLEDFAAFFLTDLREQTSLHFQTSNSLAQPGQAPKELVKHQQQQQQHFNRSGCSVDSNSNPWRQQGSGRRGGRGGGGARGSSHSFCLGDFLVNLPKQSQQRSRKKATPLQPSQNQQQARGAAAQFKPRGHVHPLTISENDSASWPALGTSYRYTRSVGNAHSEQEQEIGPQEDERAVPDPKKLQLLSAIYCLLLDLNVAPDVLSEMDFVLQLFNIRDLGQSPDATISTCKPLQLLSKYQSSVYFALKVLENQQMLLLQLDKKTLRVLLRSERLNLLPTGLVQQLEVSYKLQSDTTVDTRSSLQQNYIGKDTRDKFSSQNAREASKMQRNTCSSPQNVNHHVENGSRYNFPSQKAFVASKTQRDTCSEPQNVFNHVVKESGYNFPSQKAFADSQTQRDTNSLPQNVNQNGQKESQYNFPSQKVFLPSKMEGDTRSSSQQNVHHHVENNSQDNVPLQNTLLASKTQSDTSSSSPQNYYHAAGASRDNFPTQTDFMAFEVQRDIFYKSLKQWELGHQESTFNFASKVSPYIQNIFKISEHPVNMGHFAKLFVTQLLISAADNAEESSEEPGAELDPLRIYRSAQGMANHNPREWGYYPRSQTFFRDFIAACLSLPFLVQLKLALLAQLMWHNDSTSDLLQLTEDAAAGQDQPTPLGPYMVRVQAMTQMLILAKFVGFVSVLPFSGTTPNRRTPALPYVCSEQLQLRSHFKPDLSLRQTLEQSMRQSKLLITLPWVAHYLCVLDPVSLHLPDTLEALEILYGLHASLRMEKTQPGAVLVASHRSREGTGPSSTAPVVVHCLKEIRCHEKYFAPMLKELMPVACRFLQEFTLQQGGSSTSKTEEPENAQPQQQQQQGVPPEVLLRSPATRRLIDFIAERSFECMVKDALQELPLQTLILGDPEAFPNWKKHVTQMLDHRIAQSLEAVLPASTDAGLHSTYVELTRSQAHSMLHRWLQSSELQSALNCCDSGGSSHRNTKHRDGETTELILSPDLDFSLSQMLDQLQQWLHRLSRRPEYLGSRQELAELLQQCQQAALLPQMPTTFYEVIGSGLVHLLQLLINRKPDFMDASVIDACCAVWRSDQFKVMGLYPDIFEGLLSVLFVEDMGTRKEAFGMLEQLLSAMLQTGVMKEPELNKILMPHLEMNWSPPVLSMLANMQKRLSSSGSKGKDAASRKKHK